MCGLAGFLDPSMGSSGDELRAVAGRMADTLVHRGPDDRGAWADADAGIALGFRRLSIVDLSPEGHQPMASASGRYVVAFNGEVYNFGEIRRELEAAGPTPFRGHSDTEVVLAAVERWGVPGAVARFAGMFALALWDRAERRLHLVRDRLGEKPLYYGWVGETFLFGSELKALRAHPRWRSAIDKDVLALYLQYGYIPGPYSIYENISKLTPGTVLTLEPGRGRAAAAAEPVAYWSALRAIDEGKADPFRGTDDEAADELERLLRDAVGRQMVADVPLGAFLSGGIDSSTVVALMQAQSPRPVKTFTIGFHEPGFNEAEHAQAVARHLGTDHTELYVTPGEALAVVPQLPTLYDEPFADSSAIPFYLVSRLARREVTVCLSGDGGDELLAGYSWYVRSKKIWDLVKWVPRPLRRTAAGALAGVSRSGWDRTFRALGPALPGAVRRQATGDRVHKLAGLIGRADSPEGIHQFLLSKWDHSSRVVLGASAPRTDPPDGRAGGAGVDLIQRLLGVDMVHYLPDDILAKVDRASMGTSLEARAPFLDHRVVEFACRVPMSMKLRDGKGKWLLRRVLARHVPPTLFERPKVGFSVPIGAWLKGPLRDWAEGLLAENRLRSEGFLDPGPVRRVWDEHLAGGKDRPYHIWNVLMFQAWLEAQ